MTQNNLVSAEEILLFLENESDTEKTRAKIDACGALAQAQAQSYAMTPLDGYTPQNVPADIKTALIKWTIAEYIANSTNTNYLDGDGSYADRATRHRKEAQDLLAKYRPVMAL